MQTPDQVAVLALVDAVEDVQRRTEARDLLELMSSTTGQAPKVWGSAHDRLRPVPLPVYDRTGRRILHGWVLPDRLTFYLMSGLRGFEDLLERLGPHKAGKSTVHLKRLDDVDRKVLIELIEECVTHVDMVETMMGAIPRKGDVPPREPTG